MFFDDGESIIKPCYVCNKFLEDPVKVNVCVCVNLKKIAAGDRLPGATPGWREVFKHRIYNMIQVIHIYMH